MPLMKSSLAEIAARRERLAGVLKEEGYLSVSDLAGRFSVSEATIRRDLSALEKEKKVTRTYGGALSEYDALFVPFYQRSLQNRDLKERLAQAAAAGIGRDQTIFLDAGSTVFALAESLASRRIPGLRVVTNNLPAAEALATKGACDVFLLGGQLLPHQLVVVGRGTSLSLTEWRFDAAYLSAEGMNGEGLWNSQDEISEFQRHVCGRSNQFVFCVDDSKLGRVAPSFVMGWPEVGVVITTAERREVARIVPSQFIEHWIFV